MSEVDAAQLGARAEAMIKALGAISAEPGRLVRLFLTPEHRRAADLVAGWMREAGLTVSEDALGTVRGSIGQGPRLLIGSHIDTVIDAGQYDGPLGVIAGILAVSHFGGKPPLPIDVLAFGDEEGSRFPATMASSSACAGVFDTGTLGLADRKGVTLAEAIKAYGKNPDDIAKAAYRKDEVRAYAEVHIEQGPLLEFDGEPLGVVTGIVGQSRWRVTVTGEAGHAGTVPMRMRRDALAGAAEMALMIERVGRDNAASHMVATVGRFDVSPGATNIIPASVTFTIDLRDLDDRLRQSAIDTIRREARAVAEKRDLGVIFEVFHDAAAVASDGKLQQHFADAITALGHKPMRLPSGAGHDAQTMAQLCPSAMMFVRCRRGISHNPAEYASPADMGLAVAALIRFIERFASQ
ncbi:allantoate amidohydrolase [Pseudolabrys taiwanensis]|uniref:Allantoate amidohydrolase n=1 Tax=Pseudolabrys taiwanensis TaxID=331696 RepID=A0A345ZSV9_9HYPH|nr:allantoate amidohydrolase [Pseudolabrys taiwanensis]AXK80006.1 allantoate amidohydrolase [Pseudolabrys taiwanensis]